MVSDKVSQEKWFFYKLYITMAASLLVNQTFAIPFNFFPALVLLMLTLLDCPEDMSKFWPMSKRGIIFHASYSRSGSRGNFQKLQYQSTGESFSEAVPLPLDAL